MKLTAKQQRFVEIYDGNATAAAKAAGYQGDDNTLGVTGHDLLRLPKIAAAIAAREARRPATVRAIATREERQEFWTKMMLDTSEEPHARLKASELLGKSNADFTEKLTIEGKLTLEQLVLGAVGKAK